MTTQTADTNCRFCSGSGKITKVETMLQLAEAIKRYCNMNDPGEAWQLAAHELPPDVAIIIQDALFPTATTDLPSHAKTTEKLFDELLDCHLLSWHEFITKYPDWRGCGTRSTVASELCRSIRRKQKELQHD